MKLNILKKTAKLMAIVMSFTTLGVYPVSNVGASTKTSITVGKGGGYDYSTITAAVASISSTPTEISPVSIYVNKGIYEECVVIDKPYVQLIGSGKADDVVITYDKANGHSDPAKNTGTEKSASFTLTKEATGFKAENITFENSYNIANPNLKQVQAVAFTSNADKVALKNCNFIGRQDTLYLKGASKGQQVYGDSNNARVYLKNCYIEGTVDFIFGDATAYFDSCKLHMAYYEKGGHFTAPNTTLFNVGYVFNNCELTVDRKYTADFASKIDLGRPWQADNAYPNYGSNSVFIDCKLPELLSPEGFSLWDDTTVVNKIRFMEYGSKNAFGAKLDLSKRADYVKILTKEQAEGYNVFNVLKGKDNWNPSRTDQTNPKAVDVTLNSYELSVPLGESIDIKAIALPMGVKDGVSFSTDSNNIILEGSKIIGKSQGSGKVYASLGNGISTYANVKVTAPRTLVPDIDKIKINSKNTIKVGDKLTANYSFALDSDNRLDESLIRWYSVKDGKETLLKEGIGDYYKTYTVQNSDSGSTIALGVLPATVTTYGNRGDEVKVNAKNAVVASDRSTESYLKEGFESGFGALSTNGNWQIKKIGINGYAQTIGNGGSLEYTNTSAWKDGTYSLKLTCNPESSGLSSSDKLNIYINNKKNSYYRLSVTRGGNTKSLKINLYKSVDGKETQLYTDEDKVKNAILTAAGKDNSVINLSLSKSKNSLTITCGLEGSNTKLLNKTVTDDSAFSGGTFKVDAQGENWLLDLLSVDCTRIVDKTDALKIYLVGDSTVKYYGDDNSIGGWGEYIVNYFDEGVDIINKAEGGRSTRSYINQGRLDEVLNLLNKGDYVFIQFGHNDNRNDDNAWLEHSVFLGEPNAKGIYPTVPGKKVKTPDKLYNAHKNNEYTYEKEFYPYDSGTFKWYLQQYVVKVKEKGGIPVIITPVCRVIFDSNGKVQSDFGENNGYKVAAEQVASENNVTCINAYDITKSLYESYGAMTTQGLHNVKEDGTMDLTHYNKFGANIVASKLAEAVCNQVAALKPHHKASEVAVGKTDDMKTAKLILVGDSGVGLSKNNVFNTKGFNDYIQYYFTDKINVVDYTKAGTTAKEFMSDNNYKKMLSTVNEGDYVMISFGRYDGDKLGKGYSPIGDKENKKSFYYTLYNSYVKPVTDKKAIPILITPISERVFDAKGNAVNNTLDYSDDIRKMVADNSLYFVNLNDISYNLYKTMGQEGSKVLNALDNKTGIDNKGLSEFGARLLTVKIVQNLKFSSATLKNYIVDSHLNEQDILTRGEFAEKLANITGIDKLSYTSNFKDVLKGKSYEKAIGALASHNVIKGDSQGYFYPEAVLDGDSMIAMLKTSLKYKELDTEALKDVYALSKGKISNEIGLWALYRLWEEVK